MLRDSGWVSYTGRVGFLGFGRGEPVFIYSGQPAGNSMGELPAALVLGFQGRPLWRAPLLPSGRAPVLWCSVDTLSVDAARSGVLVTKCQAFGCISRLHRAVRRRRQGMEIP